MKIPQFANDLHITFENIQRAKHLTDKQFWGSAYAASIATRKKELITEVEKEAAKILSEKELDTARSAASVMGMNNIYWRFWYLVEDKEYLDVPAELSQEIFQNHGINETDFECFVTAVSAINNCAGCLKVHSRKLLKLGFTKVQIMAVVRTAATVHGIAAALSA